MPYMLGGKFLQPLHGGGNIDSKFYSEKTGTELEHKAILARQKKYSME